MPRACEACVASSLDGDISETAAPFLATGAGTRRSSWRGPVGAPSSKRKVSIEDRFSTLPMTGPMRPLRGVRDGTARAAVRASMASLPDLGW